MEIAGVHAHAVDVLEDGVRPLRVFDQDGPVRPDRIELLLPLVEQITAYAQLLCQPVQLVDADGILLVAADYQQRLASFSSRWSEAVTAVVVLRDGAEASEEDLIKHCRASLAGYETPKSVVFAADLPETVGGKVLKYRLRAEHAGHYADANP